MYQSASKCYTKKQPRSRSKNPAEHLLKTLVERPLTIPIGRPSTPTGRALTTPARRQLTISVWHRSKALNEPQTMRPEVPWSMILSRYQTTTPSRLLFTRPAGQQFHKANKPRQRFIKRGHLAVL